MIQQTCQQSQNKISDTQKVPECLECMGLDFSKYNKFKAWLQKPQCMNVINQSLYWVLVWADWELVASVV